MMFCKEFGACRDVGCVIRTDGSVDGGIGCVLYLAVLVCGVFYLPVGSDVVRVTHPTAPGSCERGGRFWFMGGVERERMVLCKEFGACRDVGCVIRTDGSVDGGIGCVLYLAVLVCGVFYLPYGSDVVRVTHPTAPGSCERGGRFWFMGGVERERMVLCKEFGACWDVGCAVRTAGVSVVVLVAVVCEGVAVWQVFHLPYGSDVVRVTHPTAPGSGEGVGRFLFMGGTGRESVWSFARSLAHAGM